jgi:RHH-type proline utilization regulon transcriptional repressor/proline dehydrogenase/delta 1-pyrroline-5-carboxylate dehydrogenase
LEKVKALEAQHGVKIGVTFDLEHFEYRDMTCELFMKIMDAPRFRDMERVGIVVQAYLKDAEQVIWRLSQWSQHRRETGGGKSIMIRLVKGAYWDYESIKSNQKGFDLPVFSEKWMSDVNYERCVDLVLALSDDLRLAAASHNMRSISYAVARARELGKPMTVEMLFGMGDHFKAALTEAGIPVFVYSPTGELLPGMAYLSRRILENASQNSFLRQSSGDPSPERRLQLLRNPQIDLEKDRVRDWPPTELAQTEHATLTDLDVAFVNEAYIDFSRRVHQLRVQAELTKLEYKMAILGETPHVSHPIVIGKDRVVPALTTENVLISRDPAHPDQIVGISPMSTEANVDTTVSTARTAFDEWSGTSAEDRARILLRAAQIMREKRFELIAIMMRESGKPLVEADGDIAEAIDFIEFYARDFLQKLRDNPHLKLNAVGPL